MQQDSFIELGIKLLENIEQSNNYTFTKSTILKVINELNVNINIKDLNPFIIPYRNWYKFSHSDIETYFRAKHISSFNKEQFSELITENLMHPDESNLLVFLQSTNKNKLWNYYIIPEIERLIGHLNFTNQQKTLSTFVDFFNIEFDLEWDKKEEAFRCYSSSNVESHYDHIFNFCNIKSYISDFEIYFEKELQNKETINRLFINTEALNKLYKTTKNNTPKKQVRDILSNQLKTVFEIKLLDFINNDENYNVLNYIGMVKYADYLIQKLKETRTNS